MSLIEVGSRVLDLLLGTNSDDARFEGQRWERIEWRESGTFDSLADEVL